MTTASYVDFQAHHWGWVKLTSTRPRQPDDYMLEKLDPADRAYIVDRMRAVAPNQQWGVWGAGSAWARGQERLGPLRRNGRGCLPVDRFDGRVRRPGRAVCRGRHV